MSYKQLLILSYWFLLATSCSRQDEIKAQLITHPDDKDKRIEYFIKYPTGTHPVPAIIFIHGHQEGNQPGGKAFVDWGVLNEFADKGFIAISISQPGYGNSDGPPDYCGPFTTNSVLEVIKKLKQDPRYADTLILLGISRGAIVAGFVALQEADVKAAILISGLYDLNEYANSKELSLIQKTITRAMQNEIGREVKQFENRSLINFAQHFKVPLLILHGEKDDRADPNQAGHFAKMISENGGRVQLKIYPEYGHQIPPEERNKVIIPFIDSILNK